MVCAAGRTDNSSRDPPRFPCSGMARVLSATAILSGDLSGSPWQPTSSQLAAAVPESIAKQYQNQELSIDLLFVNGIYLLHHGKCQPRHHKYIHVSCLLIEEEPTLRVSSMRRSPPYERRWSSSSTSIYHKR